MKKITDERGAITAHYISHWGVPTDIRVHATRFDFEVAILEFPPTLHRPTWRYATNGMSFYDQNHSNVKVRCELFACSKEQLPWADDLLIAIASYPMDYTTYLAEGDSIDVGGPIDRDVSAFTGILLTAPGPMDPHSLGGYGDILIHQVVGVFNQEFEYVRKFGGKRFWNSLVSIGEPVLDGNREIIKLT